MLSVTMYFKQFSSYFYITTSGHYMYLSMIRAILHVWEWAVEKVKVT